MASFGRTAVSRMVNDKSGRYRLEVNPGLTPWQNDEMSARRRHSSFVIAKLRPVVFHQTRFTPPL